MILQLQTYLQTHSRTSLEDLAKHFHSDADAMRAMLMPLIRKGRVRQLASSKPCGGCHSCAPESLEFYEWVAKQEVKNSQPSKI